MGCKGSKAAMAEPKLEIEVVDDTVSCVSLCNSPGSDDDRITIGMDPGDFEIKIHIMFCFPAKAFELDF